MENDISQSILQQSVDRPENYINSSNYGVTAENSTIGTIINNVTVNMSPHLASIVQSVQGIEDGRGIERHLHLRIDQTKKLLEQSKPSDALSLLEELIKDQDIYSNNEALYRIEVNTASAYVQMGNPSKALPHALKAFQLKKEPKVFRLLGGIYNTLDDQVSAVEKLEELRETAPESEECFLLYAELYPKDDPDSFIPTGFRSLEYSRLIYIAYALQNANFELATKVALSLENDFSNKPYYAYLAAKVLYLTVIPLDLAHIWMPFSKDKVALTEKAKHYCKKAYEGLGARADTEERYRDVYLTYLSILAISGDDFEVINVSRNLLKVNPSIEYLSFLIYAILKKDGYEKAMEEIDLYVSNVDAHNIDILRIQVLQPCNDESQIQYYIDYYKINIELIPWLIKRHINTDFIISDILEEALSSDDLDIICDRAFMLYSIGEKEMVRSALAHAISSSPDIVNTMRIALLYSNIGAEEEALEEYQKIFETGLNPNAAYAYLELLWKKQRIGVLSLALKKVDDSMMMDTNFARLKLQILFETNLPEGAREAELYLKKNIHDLWVRVQLCWYCYHYDRKKLKDFLSYNPPASSTIDNNLVLFLFNKALTLKDTTAINRIAQIVISHPTNIEAAKSIFTLFFIPNAAKDIQRPANIRINTVVELMNEGQLYDTYFIGQDINTGKLTPIIEADEKFDQLMGLSIGQNVENSSLFGLYGGTLKVGSIRSLAQYSFSESTVILRRNNLLYNINFNPENPEELHNTLGNVVSDQEDNTILLSMNPKITVNILAKIHHSKVFNIVDQLYRDANETIYTGDLTIEEFQKAIRNLGALDSHDIIFDAATLVFCSELGILKFIERFPRKILLSGKTLADLSIGDAEIESGIGSLASHCASITHTWAKVHTLTVSSLYEGSFDIVAEELLHGESLFSMYSAIGNDAVMITVDSFVRMNIEQQGGIALDLQFLLKWLYDNSFITVDELIDAYLRMRNAGFFLVSINAKLVISALSEYLKHGNVSNAFKIAEILSEEKIDFLSLIGVLTPSYNLVINIKDNEKLEKCFLWLESITDLISYRNPNFPKYTPSEYINISKMSLNLELYSMLQYNANV